MRPVLLGNPFVAVPITQARRRNTLALSSTAHQRRAQSARQAYPLRDIVAQSLAATYNGEQHAGFTSLPSTSPPAQPRAWNTSGGARHGCPRCLVAMGAFMSLRRSARNQAGTTSSWAKRSAMSTSSRDTSGSLGAFLSAVSIAGRGFQGANGELSCSGGYIPARRHFGAAFAEASSPAPADTASLLGRNSIATIIPARPSPRPVQHRTVCVFLSESLLPLPVSIAPFTVVLSESGGRPHQACATSSGDDPQHIRQRRN